MPLSQRLLTASILTVILAATLIAQQPGAPAAPGQQPPVTFKLEVNYVEVDAVVTDEPGRFIRDLTKGDFQVLEDGKPQAITVFSLVDIPIERADRPLFAARPIAPDVATNAREFDGRLYLIVLDDLHTHPLRTTRVKTAARQFIERHLGANDMAAVVYTSGRTDAGQEFTSNPQLLLASVDKFMGRKLRSSTLERIDEYYRLRDLRSRGDPINDPLDMERGYQARSALSTLKGVAEWLAGIRGRRKTLLFISEGIDYDIYDVFNARDASTVLNEAREAIAAATRGNVSVYTVDPRGLTALGDEAIEIAALPDDTQLGLGPSSLQQELRLAQDSLRVLADETGGFAALNSNDFSQAFQRIVQDSSSYYVLGYYPTNDRRDGRFRKIDVRVSRPGLRVRARKGYVAPRGRAPEPRPAATKEGTSPELRDAISNPLPVTGLTLAVFAAPFKGTAPNASVAVVVEVEGADFKFVEQDGIFLDHLEVSVVAVDEKGNVRGGDRLAIDMKMRPQTYEAVRQAGFRVTSRLEIPPGRYQLRVAARETGAGAVGSIHYDLQVPDFSQGALAMSGLALASVAAQRVPTGRPDPQFKEVLPAQPTTAREFGRDDALALFVEVYDNQASTPHKVDIATTVRADDGRVVFTATEERSTDELQGARGGFGHAAQIPLRDLPPGLYVLRVEARTRLQDSPTGFREIQFRIRDAP